MKRNRGRGRPRRARQGPVVRNPSLRAGFYANSTAHLTSPGSPMLRLAVAVCLVVPMCLSAATREEEAKRYAKDLKNKDAKVRVPALKELARLGQLQRKLTEPYVDDITGVLKDSDAKVR